MQKLKRQVVLIVLDVLIIQLAVFLGFFLRFEGVLSEGTAVFYIQQYLNWWLVITVAKLLIYGLFHMYTSLWRYASIEELFQVFFAAFFGTLALFALLFFMQVPMPRSVVILSGIFEMLLLGVSRFGYRSARIFKDFGIKQLTRKHEKTILIIGAGEAGALVAKEIKNQEGSLTKLVGFIDDDHSKLGRRINNVPVLGDRNSILELVAKYQVDEMIIAIPSSDKKHLQEILDICAKAPCHLKILPSLSELIDGKVSISAIRNVEIEDLLGRDEVALDDSSHKAFVEGKTILVTGAGGSIGSELVRQLLKLKPLKIILFDFYENNLYQLQQDLIRHYTDPAIVSIIGNVREYARVDEVMAQYKPQVVFHAAAHKHVPLMEDSPKEASKNNIMGTFHVITAAQKNGVERLIQISTDKAVNPTNVMGATKRACEMLIQAMNGISKTELIAVRFGNVLGSEGSVIPLFKKQIAEGGPVTVTHEDIIRYFMTIPEASRLVIQAGSLGKGGEIFVLDMGEPVRIYDLAEKMIRLSGFEPHTEIPIKITGLRPGEKLYEELLIDDQHTVSTSLKKIFVEKTTPLDWHEVKGQFDVLVRSLEGSEEDVKVSLADMVSTYVRNG